MARIEKILFPTDFSRSAEQAFTHAVFLAEQYGAELDLLHAVVLHSDDPYRPSHHFPSSEEILQRMYEISGSSLAELAEEHEEGPVEIRELTRRGFDAAEVILEVIDEVEADLVVMGTHGRRGPRRLILGSVAEKVVRLAPCPVMTLRERDEPRGIEAFERLLVPVDFSEHSRRLVVTARDLAATYGARLELLHVVQEHAYPYFYGPISTQPLDDHLSELTEKAGEAMDRLMADTDGPDVEYGKHILPGQPATEIVRFAEKEAIDLLVIATHGLTGLERILVGSTAEQVVRTASCPVFTVKSFGRDLVD